MSLWSRITNALKADRLNREIDEEFASHIEEAVSKAVTPPKPAKRLAPRFAGGRRAATSG